MDSTIGFVIGCILLVVIMGIYGAVITNKNKKAKIAEDLAKNTFSLSGTTFYAKKQTRI